MDPCRLRAENEGDRRAIATVGAPRGREEVASALGIRHLQVPSDQAWIWRVIESHAHSWHVDVAILSAGRKTSTFT